MFKDKEERSVTKVFVKKGVDSMYSLLKSIFIVNSPGIEYHSDATKHDCKLFILLVIFSVFPNWKFHCSW